MLSQFTDEGSGKKTLSLFDFPKDVYPVGRLDYDSEGLIILSCDDENYDKKTGILNIDSLNIGESKIINIKTFI